MIAAHDEVGIHLAFVRPSRHLERAGHVELRGEERLERILGVLLVAAPVVVFVVAHHDAHRLAHVRVQQLRKLEVLVGVSRVGRVAHEEVRVHVGRESVDGGEGRGDFVAVVVARACADVGVAMHGEPHARTRERGPVRVFRLGERGFGPLLGEDEHASGGRHAGDGGQLEKRAARDAERAAVVCGRELLGIHDVLSIDNTGRSRVCDGVFHRRRGT